MEYIRKQRWANYLSPKCKEYLRNDFSHECAYCKLQEQEVGIVGLDFFEIDHFKPQSLNLPDTHKYHNSCQLLMEVYLDNQVSILQVQKVECICQHLQLRLQ